MTGQHTWYSTDIRRIALVLIAAAPNRDFAAGVAALAAALNAPAGDAVGHRLPVVEIVEVEQ